MHTHATLVGETYLWLRERLADTLAHQSGQAFDGLVLAVPFICQPLYFCLKVLDSVGRYPS